ncbi:MAG: UDP-N-acetylmuramate dehydrogenase [Chloroflexi bacterium]|nr:UDP-N-acetylmuramate dehydrogenase [Chloroflexota bacterium]
MVSGSAKRSSTTWPRAELGCDELARALGQQASRGELLSAHTSFRIGGPADLFVPAQSVAELMQYVTLARGCGVPCFLLGLGTNILVADRGIRGLVIWNRSKGLQTDFVPGPSGAVECIVRAESGLPLAQLAHYTARLGLAGLEWAAGIPGTLGGAVVNNAGAHDGDMSQVLRLVTILTPAGRVETWPAERLGLGYRSSCLRAEGPGGHVVLSAEMVLQRQNATALLERIEGYQAQRQQKQPRRPSAGSVFANPPGDYAGRLIEAAGLKGRAVGDAQISPQHANFIVNQGQASAQDVLALIELARQEVLERFGVRLRLEIQLVGEWPDQTHPSERQPR